MYADGGVPELLGRVGAADLDRTVTTMRRLYPGREIEQCEGSNLGGRRVPAGGDGVRSELAGRGGHR